MFAEEGAGHGIAGGCEKQNDEQQGLDVAGACGEEGERRKQNREEEKKAGQAFAVEGDVACGYVGGKEEEEEDERNVKVDEGVLGCEWRKEGDGYADEDHLVDGWKFAKREKGVGEADRGERHGGDEEYVHPTKLIRGGFLWDASSGGVVVEVLRQEHRSGIVGLSRASRQALGGYVHGGFDGVHDRVIEPAFLGNWNPHDVVVQVVLDAGLEILVGGEGGGSKSGEREEDGEGGGCDANGGLGVEPAAEQEEKEETREWLDGGGETDEDCGGVVAPGDEEDKAGGEDEGDRSFEVAAVGGEDQGRAKQSGCASGGDQGQGCGGAVVSGGSPEKEDPASQACEQEAEVGTNRMTGEAAEKEGVDVGGGGWVVIDGLTLREWTSAAVEMRDFGDVGGQVAESLMKIKEGSMEGWMPGGGVGYPSQEIEAEQQQGVEP